MYNIKLIPYLALYKYMFTLLHRGLLWKVLDFQATSNCSSSFQWKATIFPKSNSFQLASVLWEKYTSIHNKYKHRMDKLSNGSSKKHNWIFHSTNILKTLFLYFLVFEKLCGCQTFLCNENTKKWWHLCSLEYGEIGWHWSKEIFQWCPEIEYELLIIVKLCSKLSQPFLVEKELHYDNVIRLCFTVFLVWIALRNASEGSLIILKMTAVENCLKTTRIYRIIRSIRETLLFGREIYPDMFFFFAFLSQCWSFGKWKAWKLMKFWENFLVFEYFWIVWRSPIWKTVVSSISGVCWWNTE